jgi:rhamnulose-1-phosphate aldolase
MIHEVRERVDEPTWHDVRERVDEPTWSGALRQITDDLAAAGEQLTVLGACEGAAGNASVITDEDVDVPLPSTGVIELPVDATPLAGLSLVLTASGARLRDIGRRPHRSLVVLHITDRSTAELRAEPGVRPSSEWGSHLAVHARCWRAGRHAVVHAQPHHLTMLSHLPACASSEWLTERLLRWEAETTIAFPEGLSRLAFMVPGSAELVAATADALADRRLVVWAKHGVVVRHDTGAVAAADLIEYAEAAARYELHNLALGAPASGFTEDERAAIDRAFRP